MATKRKRTVVVVGTLSSSKRARTASCCRRDWANLTAGPAGQIAEAVLADDVAGYLRFRAVCAPWRRCTDSPHGGLLDRIVHRVDLDAGRIVPVGDLRGRAVFVCEHTGRAVSVRAGLSASIRADTVYVCRRNVGYDGEERRPRIGVCHVENGWITRDLRFFRRGGVVDHLSRYVCRSKDAVVPARRPWYRKANSKVFGKDWIN